jgi:predicted esterase
MSLTKVFIHGLDGGSNGTKGRFFRKTCPDMLIEDFSGTLQQRMDKLNRLLFDKTSLIIIGSSFGGLMGAIFACKNPERVKKLILLAPALTFPEFEAYLQEKIDIAVTIYHGQNDDVISVGPVHEIARIVFRNLTSNVVEDDHVLSNTFISMDWDGLLETRRTAS